MTKSKYHIVYLTHIRQCWKIFKTSEKIIKVKLLSKSEKNFMKQETLCQSLGGLPIHLLTITEPSKD